MTDLMKIALGRRAELQAEIVRMDAFIRMAEALAHEAHPGAHPDEADRDAEVPVGCRRDGAPVTGRMSLVRRGPALVVV